MQLCAIYNFAAQNRIDPYTPIQTTTPMLISLGKGRLVIDKRFDLGGFRYLLLSCHFSLFMDTKNLDISLVH